MWKRNGLEGTKSVVGMMLKICRFVFGNQRKVHVVNPKDMDSFLSAQ